MNEKRISMKTKLLIALMNVLSFPKIPAAPKKNKWYQIPLPNCVSADGSIYHGSLRIGTENKVMVVFHGGGVSWNEYMAARPNSVYLPDDGEDCFYALDGHLVADVAIGHGLSSKKKLNPFRNWSIISIPYCSGDFHCGMNDYPYTAKDGSRQILYHHGYKNYRAVMDEALKFIGTNPKQLMVTGFSAGGFGTALLADDVMSLFPNCKNVICYVDSGFMLFDDWHMVAEQVWKAPKEISDRLHTNDITLDSLQALKSNHGDRVKILFSCSTRDAALAEYWTYIKDGKLYADRNTGIQFQKDLRNMCQKLLNTIPDVGIYIFNSPVSGAGMEKKVDTALYWFG